MRLVVVVAWGVVVVVSAGVLRSVGRVVEDVEVVLLVLVVVDGRVRTVLVGPRLARSSSAGSSSPSPSSKRRPTIDRAVRA